MLRWQRKRYRLGVGDRTTLRNTPHELRAINVWVLDRTSGGARNIQVHCMTTGSTSISSHGRTDAEKPAPLLASEATTSTNAFQG